MLAIVREAWATAMAQPVASIVTIAIVAGMCLSVVLTTGRTVGNEQAVLSSIDSEGTRSIVVRADAESGLDTTVLERVSNIEGISWVGAFGTAIDSANAHIPEGTRVPIRKVWGEDLSAIGLPPAQYNAGGAWASSLALAQLGMPDSIGGVDSGSGQSFSVNGRLDAPDYLDFLEPLVLVPQPAENGGAVSVLLVIAERPDLVAPVAAAVQSVLALDDESLATVSTSEDLASLRASVEGQLGTFAQNLLLIIFTLTAVLVAAILYGLVMMRRKDFGRRRALGATRRLIILLLLTQIASLSTVGAAVGSAAAAVLLAAAGDPLPTWDFFIAVSVLAVSVGTMAGVIPAVAASRRDPIRELRVP